MSFNFDATIASLTGRFHQICEQMLAARDCNWSRAVMNFDGLVGNLHETSLLARKLVLCRVIADWYYTPSATQKVLAWMHLHISTLQLDSDSEYHLSQVERIVLNLPNNANLLQPLTETGVSELFKEIIDNLAEWEAEVRS